MTTEPRNERVVLAAVPDGKLRPSDLRLETGPVPVPGDGEMLLETIFLSIDPYMRFWMRREKSYHTPIAVGQLMIGGTVSRVRRSRHPHWREGDWALGFSGWQRFAISDGSGLRRIDPAKAPPSTALGVLGMTGFTAYAGLRNTMSRISGRSLTVSGFIQTEFAGEQMDDLLREATGWLIEGRVRHREHMVQGVEQAPPPWSRN